MGARAGRLARRLERPALRARASVDRLHRTRGRALYPDESAAGRKTHRTPLPGRPARRLRRVAGDGAPLPRALRRRVDPRHGEGAARAQRDETRPDAGAGLDHVRPDGLMSTPVSWFLIEPGWTVEAADGSELGHVEEVTGDSNADVFDGLTVASTI